MLQLRSHCHQIIVNEIDKVVVSSFDENAYFYIMAFLHWPRGIIELELP